MCPSYYRDRLYLQLIVNIFASSLVVAAKGDFTSTMSKENKKNIACVVADKTHFATVSTEVKSICCYNWK